jgi:hypothetical protein
LAGACWRKRIEVKDERKTTKDETVGAQGESSCAGEGPRRAIHATVRLLLYVFGFFVPIFGCEPLEEGISAMTLREIVKESTDFDRVKSVGD